MRIHGFHGVRYSVRKVGCLSDVVTQPYDKIGYELQNQYYGRSPFNFVRLIKGCVGPGGTGENIYADVYSELRSWIHDGVLVQDRESCMYIYQQIFKLDGRERSRLGLMVLGEMESLSACGGVRPHEMTLAAPKLDRLNLIRACKAHLEPIFMLFDDPEGLYASVADRVVSSPPDIEASDDDGFVHRVWGISDGSTHERLSGLLRESPVWIADGHHRYETALSFSGELRMAGVVTDPPKARDCCLMTLVPWQDPGLVVLPIHRIIEKIESYDRFLSALDEFFSVQAGPEDQAPSSSLWVSIQSWLNAHIGGAFVCYLGRRGYRLLRVREECLSEVTCIYKTWGRLDTAILQELVLKRILGMTATSIEQEKGLSYNMDPLLAIQDVRSGLGDAAFLMNPTPLGMVREIADTGERMPPKSTNFYPKLLSGMIFSRIPIV
jgi:uncharacterized protein (DUF1015 family)